jgi:O-antigen/teichoic acid export membrane protein
VTGGAIATLAPDGDDLTAPGGTALEGLRGKILGGLAWVTFSQLTGWSTRIVVTIILAHLLSPAQFGPAGLALTISSLSLVLADPSLGAALVRLPVISEDDRSTVFWVNVACGALFATLGIALSPLVGSFFGSALVGRLFAVESLTFLLIGLSATQAAVLTRQMSFRSLELREMGGTVAGGVIGIALAASGFGAWAIIAQSVAGAAVATALLWALSSWRPRLRFSGRSLRETGSFGSRLFGAKLLGWVDHNADNLLVGKFLGTGAPLGLYSGAYNFGYTPITRITLPAQAVVVPAFARVQQDRARLAAAWLRGNGLLAAVMMPVFLGMIVVAPDIVPVALGHRWHHAAPVVQFLCWAGLMESLQSLTGSMLTARGQASLVFRISIWQTALYIAGFVVGLHWGIVGVAASYAITRTIGYPFVVHYAGRMVGISFAALARKLAGVTLAALSMLATTVATRELLVAQGVPAAARLPLVVAVGVGSYLGASWLAAPKIVGELRDLRRRPAEA